MTVSFTGSTLRETSTHAYDPSVLDTMIISAAYSTAVMAPLMRMDSLAGQNTDTKRFPRWPALTAVAVAENADLAHTPIALTSVSVTAGEVGFSSAISDNLDEDSILNPAAFAREAGRAVADKWDTDCAALLAAHSNATGVTTGGLTLATFQSAIWKLAGRDAPGPYVAVLSTRQAAQLAADASANGGNIFTNRRDSELEARSGYWMSLFGVDIYTTTNVPTGTRGATATDEGAIFSRGQTYVLVAKRGVRVEYERDASARLTEVNVTTRYGVGELVDAYGETLYSNQN